MATDARTARKLSWFAAGSAVAVLVAPKCPICLAAYLSWLGVGLGFASFAAPMLAPLALALGVAALALRSRRAARIVSANRGARRSPSN